MPPVLFLGSGHDDFLADGLFHGLRSVLGPEAVDLPRIDHLYADHPDERRPVLHGMGFPLSGLLGTARDVYRVRALYRAADGAFDLVVFADIWRNFGAYVQWMPVLQNAGVAMAVVDTGARIEPSPYSCVWWRVRFWWLLPRAHNRTLFLKREITRWLACFRTWRLVP